MNEENKEYINGVGRQDEYHPYLSEKCVDEEKNRKIIVLVLAIGMFVTSVTFVVLLLIFFRHQIGTLWDEIRGPQLPRSVPDDIITKIEDFSNQNAFYFRIFS